MRISPGIDPAIPSAHDYRVMVLRSLFLSCLAAASLTVAQGHAQQPAIQTERTGARPLPLPKSEDSFHFMIFGDRTGGPPEGLLVLDQAVKDTNLLDPDLVFTVGDLINGYSPFPEWEKEMKEYTTTMNRLQMPWFPVAGNHDIYWRGAGRPETEHEANFEKHFGPLYYWFQHKNCGFITLFSDEGDGSGAQREFTRPSNQSMSARQLAWLERTLTETKSLRHVFVFLHHPRWIEATYPAAQWDKVHNVLKAAGNVRAVFAGHIHRLRYDGIRDGIEYITLATTGGSMPGHYPNAGYVHHMNLVTVRPDGFKSAIIPVGSVMDPKDFTPEFIAEIDRLRALPVDLQAAPVSLNPNGRGAGLVEFKITNPVQSPIDITVLPAGSPGEWLATADHVHFVVPPSESRTGSFSMVRTREGFDGGLNPPSLELRVEMLHEGLRIPLPPRTITLGVRLNSLPADFFTDSGEKALRFDGKSAVRVEMGTRSLPDGPFTIETWVRPASDDVSGDLISKAEQSEFALNIAHNVPGVHLFAGGRYLSAIATAQIPAAQWTHLAGVFDNSSLTLYVNGTRTASVPASGQRGLNPLPLFLGANPDARSNPTQILKGELREARLSKSVRYTADFSPQKRLSRDDETVFLFHCDRLVGPFLPSDSSNALNGVLTGKLAITSP